MTTVEQINLSYAMYRGISAASREVIEEVVMIKQDGLWTVVCDGALLSAASLHELMHQMAKSGVLVDKL